MTVPTTKPRWPKTLDFPARCASVALLNELLHTFAKIGNERANHTMFSSCSPF